jgi:multidrug efflux system outer membrane protein
MKVIVQRFSALLALLLILASCSLKPDYRRPEAPVPQGWPRGDAYSDSQAAPRMEGRGWRDFFRDEKMKEVISIALENNRDLRLAALNVERTRALYGIQRGELFPSLTGSGDANIQRIPADLSSTGRAKTAEQYSLSMGFAAWEIDFFGRIRSLEERALEEFLATEQAHRGAKVLLVSSVASAYLNLAADRENLMLAKKTLEAQQEAYGLIKRRYELGLVSELDLNRAQTQLDSAKADIWRFTQLAAQSENALSLLLGAPLPERLSAGELSSVTPSEELSAGTSSEILLKRPDIIAAEHRLRAAYANIGAARAALFPRISLTASAGTASADLSGLFESGSGTWLFVPQVTIPIFDSRLWAAYDVTKFEREIALTQYEKAIQTAFREVSDALALKGTVDKQLSAQQSLVDAVERTYKLSRLRYEKGLDSYLGVLDAQRSLYSARQGLVALRLARLLSQVRLYSVLGGGTEP